MKTYFIEFIYKGVQREEFIQAHTANRAIQSLMDKVRDRGMPVNIKICSIQHIKIGA